MSNDNNIPMYIVEDAIKFISDRSNLDESVITTVLELEENYMRSIGLIMEDSNICDCCIDDLKEGERDSTGKKF